MTRAKTCRTCKQPVPERPIKEDQSRNGVRVMIYRYASGTVVDAACQCFGATFRLHSNENCSLLKRLRAGEHVRDD